MTPMFRESAADVADVKAAAPVLWGAPGAGYQEMAETLRPAMEHLLDVAAIGAGQRVLDIATGTGLAAIAAARRGAAVTGIDIAPDLLAEARRLAEEAGLAIQYLEADAEALPFDDGAFDAVISSFGSIFAPRHDALAWEMCRVLRPGGTLAFSAWKPEGPNVRLMQLLLPFMPPAPDRPGPFRWGMRECAEELLAPYATDIAFAEGDVPLVLPSPSDAIDFLFYRALGPTMVTFSRFDAPTKRKALNAAIALLRGHLRPDGSVELGRAYLLVRATRR